MKMYLLERDVLLPVIGTYPQIELKDIHARGQLLKYSSLPHDLKRTPVPLDWNEEMCEWHLKYRAKLTDVLVASSLFKPYHQIISGTFLRFLLDYFGSRIVHSHRKVRIANKPGSEYYYCHIFDGGNIEDFSPFVLRIDDHIGGGVYVNSRLIRLKQFPAEKFDRVPQVYLDAADDGFDKLLDFQIMPHLHLIVVSQKFKDAYEAQKLVGHKFEEIEVL